MPSLCWRTTDTGLGDIAQAPLCGFNSVESMPHHFRKLKGCPPTWFRARSMRA